MSWWVKAGAKATDLRANSGNATKRGHVRAASSLATNQHRSSTSFRSLHAHVQAPEHLPRVHKRPHDVHTNLARTRPNRRARSFAATLQIRPLSRMRIDDRPAPQL